MIHLYGQSCRVCGEEVKPGDRYCSIEGVDGRNVDFIHRACCDQCSKAGDQ